MINRIVPLLPALLLACGSSSAGSQPTDGGTVSDAHTEAPVGSESGTDGAADGGAQDADAAPTDSGSLDAAYGPGCPAQMIMTNCSPPLQCGPVATAQEVLQPAPTAQGGTISPGTYYLTKLNVYRPQHMGGAPYTLQIAMVLNATSYAVNAYNDGFQETPSSGDWSSMGTNFVRSPTCPAVANSYSHPYTATANQLILYEPGATSTDTYELIETKQ